MVTIVVPVYNEINFIRKTLASIDGQADKIILCDNASTDGTSEICAKFAASRPYVTYVRSEENLGATANFDKCVELTTTKYIFTMGGHDIIEPNHVENCLEALKANDAVHAYGKVYYLNTDYKKVGELVFGYAKMFQHDNPCVRVAAVCADLDGCFRLYGLYKTKILKKIYKARYAFEYIATDRVLLASLAKLGKSILQTKSCYLAMQPRAGDVGYIAMCKRIIKAVCPNKNYSHLLWPDSHYTGQMSILDSLKPENEEYQLIVEDAKQFLSLQWDPYRIKRTGLHRLWFAFGKKVCDIERFLKGQ